MANTRLTQAEKEQELKRLRDILIAILDHSIEVARELRLSGKAHPEEVDPTDEYHRIKGLIEEEYRKGQLTKLKQSFRDITEDALDDLALRAHIKHVTGYDVDLLSDFHRRIESIIAKKRITTENQYRDVLEMVDRLCQTDPVDTEKIDTLNHLLLCFEDKLSGKKERRKKTKTSSTKYYSRDFDKVYSPSQKRFAQLFENGEMKEDAITQIYVDFGDGGGGIFATQGTDLPIKLVWQDESRLQVILPKGLTPYGWPGWKTRTQFRSEVVTIEYVEE